MTFFPQGEGSPTPTVTFTAENYLSETLEDYKKAAASSWQGTVSTRKSFLSVTAADEG